MTVHVIMRNYWGDRLARIYGMNSSVQRRGCMNLPPPPPPPGESSCSNSEIKLGEGNYLLTSSMPPWFGHGRVPGRDRHWWVHCFCQTTVLQNQRGLYFEIGQLREEINSPTWVLVRRREESLFPHWMFRNAFCWPKCPVQCSALKYVHPKVITVIVIYLGTFVLLTSCRLNVRRSFAWPPAASTACLLSCVCLFTISVSIRIANCLFVVVKAALVLSIHCHWLAFIEMLLIFNLFCWI